MIKKQKKSGSHYDFSQDTTQGMNLFVTTGRGIEPVLLAEILDLALDHNLPLEERPQEGVAGVSLRAPFETMVALNMGLTTASRVMWTLLENFAPDADSVYTLVTKIPWEKIFGVNQTFKVEAHCKDSFTTNSMFLALKVKDAIADSFRETLGQRPSVDPRNPDVTIVARLQAKKLTISIDTSGETLTNHGYRVADGNAPLRENLAAAMVRATGWCELARSLRDKCEPVFFERARPENDENTQRRISLKVPLLPAFTDPMCGTGTLGIEAALILLNKKPNVQRDYFAFQSLSCFCDAAFTTIRENIKSKILSQEMSVQNILKRMELYSKNIQNSCPGFTPSPQPIVMSDISGESIMATRRNAQAASVLPLIDIGRCSFFEGETPASGGILVMNPPYGERLQDETAVMEMYARIGNTLKHHYKGWTAWIISSSTPALKRIGLRPTRKIGLYNGQLPCQYQQYVLY